MSSNHHSTSLEKNTEKTSTTTYIPTDNVETTSETFITQYGFSGFEGPEKKLEIEFEVIQKNKKDKDTPSMRHIKKSTWDVVLAHAKCEIISQTSNKHFDSYVLSESSLFVYEKKIMIKTCGTTTLLGALAPILKNAKEEGLEPVFVFYSRKNFVFPDRQIGIQKAWSTEEEYLEKFFEGKSFVFGDPKKDHWNLYIADYRDYEEEVQYKDQRIEILMHDLCPIKMKQFYKEKDFISVEHLTNTSGIQGILPDAKIDAFQFDPCGYSMNGLLNNSYSTIHITPEKACSYVSYETNISLADLKEQGMKNYGELVRRVIDVFSPGRALVVLFSDDGAFDDESSSDVMDCKKALNAVLKKDLKTPQAYKCIGKSFHDFKFPYNLSFESLVKDTNNKK